MADKQFVSQQRIISALKDDYAIEVAALEFLPLGADRNASVYKARAKDQKCYFVKLKRAYNHEISLSITKILYEFGMRQIILPIPTIHGGQTHRIDDLTLIVYPFIVGEDGFSRDLSSNQWTLLGKALRQIHEVKVPPTLQDHIRRETYSDTWRNAVRSLLKTRANDIGSARNLFEFIKENEEVISRLVERAEELSRKLKPQPCEFVLCHSDIHGGNVLIDENDEIYIVDWDEPIMAPKERDLMFIGGGVGNLWNKPHEEESFYKGYGSTKIDRTILAYYRIERIVVDIAQFCEEVLLPISDQDKQKIYELFTGMFNPNGVVDIALRTDNDFA